MGGQVQTKVTEECHWTAGRQEQCQKTTQVMWSVVWKIMVMAVYSSPSIERPLPQKTTSSYRPLLPYMDALTVHTIKPPLEDHLLLETKLRWI